MKIINMNEMFSGCKSLVTLADIDNLNTKSVKNMSIYSMNAYH